MSIPTETRAIILVKQPTGDVTPDHWRVETRPIPELKDDQILLKAIAWSNDPAQRTWIDGSVDPKRHYIPLVNAGDIMRSGTLAEVVKSTSSKWKVGQRVTAYLGWCEYGVVDANDHFLTPAASVDGHSELISLSFCGLTGLTAYVGAYGECKLQKEHTVAISGAAGAVGSCLVQLAKKVIGCKKVVGIAGGKAKCDWVKSLGADECIDYKDPNYPSFLAKALPNYADVYFDNVGGEILDKMLTLVKRNGFVSVCGAIAGYNGNPLKLEHWAEVVYNRITIKGFLNFDHPNLMAKGSQELAEYVRNGTLDVTGAEQVEEAKFEDIPKVWEKLFNGGNTGKLITKLV